MLSKGGGKSPASRRQGRTADYVYGGQGVGWSGIGVNGGSVGRRDEGTA